MSEKNLSILKQSLYFKEVCMRFQIHFFITVHLYLRTVTSRKAKVLVVTSERISRKKILCKFVTVIIAVNCKMYYDLHRENVNIICYNS